jgi:hypothetical protein
MKEENFVFSLGAHDLRIVAVRLTRLWGGTPLMTSRWRKPAVSREVRRGRKGAEAAEGEPGAVVAALSNHDGSIGTLIMLAQGSKHGARRWSSRFLQD